MHARPGIFNFFPKPAPGARPLHRNPARRFSSPLSLPLSAELTLPAAAATQSEEATAPPPPTCFNSVPPLHSPRDCRTHLQASSDYGATHLMEHYDKTCKKRKREMDIRQSLTNANRKISGSQELTTHVFNQEESRDELAKMVILHDSSLGIVEHVGFRRFVASIQPRFNMVSRNTLNNDILKIYNEEKVKCYQLLNKLKCRIAITTHMKTSSNNKKGFMAITAHFIDDSWILGGNLYICYITGM
ncbi:Zinc finger BED domain-containing protein DAYSLEEPER [Sesamum angolense]|uniref:Zinc finger BED domain-containing protein DAYSLEEPER n=1 Tax=Sesamum angolense TaxID=2727404 RepID=A0AAE1WNC7_9LAMI|nr:Zinc finger BED domain-containing protein DAYSLEEPER [Sesamum angolense]